MLVIANSASVNLQITEAIPITDLDSSAVQIAELFTSYGIRTAPPAGAVMRIPTQLIWDLLHAYETALQTPYIPPPATAPDPPKKKYSPYNSPAIPTSLILPENISNECAVSAMSFAHTWMEYANGHITWAQFELAEAEMRTTLHEFVESTQTDPIV